MKKDNRRIGIFSLFFVCLALVGLGFFYLQGVVRENEKRELLVPIDLKDTSFQEQEFYVSMKASKSWNEASGEKGCQFDGVFYNETAHDIMNWKVEIEVPDQCRIDSSWNGVYTINGKTLTITPVDYNMVIEKNSEETFGMVMYVPPEYHVQFLKVTAYKSYRVQDFALYWILLSLLFALGVSMIVYASIELRIRYYRVKRAEDQNFIRQSLNTFANFIDAKDPYTKGHSARVAVYSRELARRMGIKDAELDNLYYIALLHDVGKVGIRSEILEKPGKLTPEEWQMVQMHTTIGAGILKDFTALPGISEGARFHHEKYDGTGYPNGLIGQEIPLFARIICVADSYDAMSSDRYYRKRLSDEQIRDELIRCSGTQFDPEIVVHMIEMVQEGFTQDVIEKEMGEAVIYRVS